jgi:hypothetical protein
VDWPSFLHAASNHRLVPLAHSHLRRLDPNPAPTEALGSLWAGSERIRRQNVRMKDELVSVLSALQADGLRVVAYKGPLLALQAYGELSMREFMDLDILVPFADLARAKKALEAIGYRSEYPLPAGLEQAYLASPHNYHLEMLDASESLRVELHWKTDAEFAVERTGEDTWWSGLPRALLDGRELSSLPARELVLVLCLHGSKHYWSRLSWLVDVAELMRKQPDLDWQWIIRRAEQLRSGTRLALALHLLAGLLEVPLAPMVAEWLATQARARRMSELIARKYSEPDAPAPTALERVRLNFAMYESWRQRLGHLSRVVFKPTAHEWSLWQLPPALAWLYPLLRVQRLFRKYLSALIGRDELDRARP